MNNERGQIAVELLLFSTLAVILVSGFVSLSASFIQLSVRGLNKSQAFTIAEAGIEYYRWHLAHAPLDFQDGTGQPGPYAHNYYDKDGKLLGQFVLAITPPPSGSTIVTIRSTGKVLADPNVQKVIEVRLGIHSFAKYAWVFNDSVSFGAGASVYGPIHTNAGISFSGTAYNSIVSSLISYDDPDHAGANEYAVHTHVNPVDPLPPTPLPSRPDVFTAGRAVGVPAVDFTKLTQDLSSIKSVASSSGLYFPSSTVLGYDLAFATSGLYSVYKVTALMNPPSNCTSTGGATQQGWGTWSVQSETLHATGTIPANGQMFFEDNLWVRGQINGKRVTVGSGRFPDNATTRSSITVNKSLRYTNYDGTDSIGLIAQKNINIGLMSDDNLRIDGALVATNGRTVRYSYTTTCGATRLRASITTYGMLGAALRGAFLYSSTNGYQSRSYNYDPNLLYGPPPGFPLTSDQYTLLSWNEVQ